MAFLFRPGGPLVPGINYRLAYGWDFGRSARAPLGVSEPARAALLDADFALLAAHRVRVVRWLVFGDGRNGIVFDGEAPAGIEPCVFANLRTALDTAARHGLSILFVLLDHTFCFAPERAAADMIKQGHGMVLRSPRLFDALLTRVLGPFFEAVANHPAVAGYELINEPEMVMRRRNRWLGRASGIGCGEVPKEWQMSFAEMSDRMIRTREAVHSLTGAQFSIGSMTASWMGRWAALLDPARDLLTFHYYGDEPDFERLLTRHVAPYAARMAVGLGEFYPQGAACPAPGHRGWPDISTEQFLDAAARYRLQAALAWVWRPGAGDPGEIPLAAYLAFAGKLEHNEGHARSTSLHES